jgi:transcriptional regulator with XRE-family HTH domain
MSLYEEIRDIRLKMGLDRKEFAKKIKISEIYVVTLEAAINPKKGQKRPTPSPAILKRIAKAATKDENERALIEKNLLSERAKLAISKELNKYASDNKLDEKMNVVGGSMMPLEFIGRLREDIKVLNSSADKIEYKGVSDREIELVLNGQLILSRKQVVELAMQLNQPVEEYLLLADYMPDSIRDVVKSTGDKMQALFRKLVDLSPENIDAMVDVFDTIYTMCQREGKQGDGKAK